MFEFPKDVLDVLNESLKKNQKKSLQDSLEKAWKNSCGDFPGDVPGGIFELKSWAIPKGICETISC